MRWSHNKSAFCIGLKLLGAFGGVETLVLAANAQGAFAVAWAQAKTTRPSNATRPPAAASTAPNTASNTAVSKPFRAGRAVAIVVKEQALANANPELVKGLEENFPAACAALKKNLMTGPESPWGLSPFGLVACETEAASLKLEPTDVVYRTGIALSARAFTVEARLAGGGQVGLAAALDPKLTKGKPVARATVRATRVALQKLKSRRFQRLIAATLVDGMPFLSRIDSDNHPALVKAPAKTPDDSPEAAVATEATEATDAADAADASSDASAGKGVYDLPAGPAEFGFAQVVFNPKTTTVRLAPVSGAKAKTGWQKQPVWATWKAARNSKRKILTKKLVEALKVVDPKEDFEGAPDPAPGESPLSSLSWRFRGQFGASALRELNFSRGGFAARASLRLGVGGPYPGYPYVLAGYGDSKIFLLTQGDSAGESVSVSLSRLRYGLGWRVEIPFASNALVLVADPYVASEKSTLKTSGIANLGNSLSDKSTATLYGGEFALMLSSANVGVRFSGGVEQSFRQSGAYSSWSLGASGEYRVGHHSFLGSPASHALQLMVGYESFQFTLAPSTGERVFDLGLTVGQPGVGLGYVFFW